MEYESCRCFVSIKPSYRLPFLVMDECLRYQHSSSIFQFAALPYVGLHKNHRGVINNLWVVIFAVTHACSIFPTAGISFVINCLLYLLVMHGRNWMKGAFPLNSPQLWPCSVHTQSPELKRKHAQKHWISLCKISIEVLCRRSPICMTALMTTWPLENHQLQLSSLFLLFTWCLTLGLGNPLWWSPNARSLILHGTNCSYLLLRAAFHQ